MTNCHFHTASSLRTLKRYVVHPKIRPSLVDIQQYCWLVCKGAQIDTLPSRLLFTKSAESNSSQNCYFHTQHPFLLLKKAILCPSWSCGKINVIVFFCRDWHLFPGNRSELIFLISWRIEKEGPGWHLFLMEQKKQCIFDTVFLISSGSGKIYKPLTWWS